MRANRRGIEEGEPAWKMDKKVKEKPKNVAVHLYFECDCKHLVVTVVLREGPGRNRKDLTVIFQLLNTTLYQTRAWHKTKFFYRGSGLIICH
jgi:hypothetical protein